MSEKKRAERAPREKDSGPNKLDLRNEIQEEHSTRAEHWFTWVFDALPALKRADVLDLGGGTGQLWAENSHRIPRGWRLALSDLSINMLHEARGNSRTILSQACMVVADSQNIPLADEQVDLVTAVGLFDLVADIPQALQEARRVLRPGGRIVATAGGAGHLSELESLLHPYLPADLAKSIGGNEDRFGMENGEAALSPFFHNITRRDFHDRLIFHEAQPILNYVLSEQAVLSTMTLNQLGDLIGRVRRRLEKSGAITITIHKGVFTAERRP